MAPYKEIRKAIEEALHKGEDQFIIYPYGEMGMITKQILNENTNPPAMLGRIE